MALVDIYARHADDGFAWIPKPINKQGPLLNYDATLKEVYELLTIYPQVWIYDSATKKAINLSNLSEYFSDYDPGGGSGGVTPEQLAVALQGKVDKVDGKILSTNDYTDDDKQKVQSMSEKMNKTLTTWKGTQAEYDELEITGLQQLIGTTNYAFSISSRNTAKLKAIEKILKKEFTFGNIKMIVNFEYQENDETKLTDVDFKTAFSGNKILNDVKIADDVMIRDGMTFVLFKKEVIQFFNDDLMDYYGYYSGLAEDIAKEVFVEDDRIRYGTDII